MRSRLVAGRDLDQMVLRASDALPRLRGAAGGGRIIERALPDVRSIERASVHGGSDVPGEQVFLDTMYVGNLKGCSHAAVVLADLVATGSQWRVLVWATADSRFRGRRGAWGRSSVAQARKDRAQGLGTSSQVATGRNAVTRPYHGAKDGRARTIGAMP